MSPGARLPFLLPFLRPPLWNADATILDQEEKNDILGPAEHGILVEQPFSTHLWTFTQEEEFPFLVRLKHNPRFYVL